ncbi:Imm21 family immunity protein [Streptomyces sp. MD20-1-1]|uniref:Imm21 family immunity protein n=1 Tax=Streptomyces sp. MD20-1-1 TaxID=3028668 RepID=UPI0029B26729|nr:Imm21 family immunity protein [Streptomyces sp. MD20-1-1]WTC20910.1 immunity 21 family protein [Streptomyces cellulosae]
MPPYDRCGACARHATGPWATSQGTRILENGDAVDLTWVESAGGPVIVMEESLRNLWGGYANFDYENACKVDGYAGLVTFGKPSAPVTGLVINDIPAPTAFMKEYRSIVQWISSPSDARFVEAVREGIGSVGMWDEGPIVRVNGPLAIFDAALPGIEASTDELLFVEIEPTAYRVRTADIESDTGTCARVHRLDPVTEISTAI